MKREYPIQAITPCRQRIPVYDVKSFLKDEPNIEQRKRISHQISSIMIATLDGALDIVKYQFSRSKRDLNKEVYGPFSRNLLHLAAVSGNKQLIEFLLQNLKINLENQDDRGYTPLDLAQGDTIVPLKEALN